MHYPIFNSIVNTVESQLEHRGVKAKKFRIWEDNKIHATGLEIIIGLDKVSGYMKSLSFNFDWDSFREVTMAKALKGMENHPFLKIEKLNEASVKPVIDIEVCWMFDIDRCQPEIPGESGNYRIEKASRWMEAISNKVNEYLAEDDIITRWHIEIDGDLNGRYLSAINLISYFQYELGAPNSFDEVHSKVSRRLHNLLLKANKVIYLSDETLGKLVAA